MINLNLRVNYKFFVTVLSIFQVEFLLSAFSNFRFGKVNSAFGIASLSVSIFTIALVLFTIGISGWKTYQMKLLRPQYVNWIWDQRRRKVISKQHPFEGLN